MAAPPTTPARSGERRHTRAAVPVMVAATLLITVATAQAQDDPYATTEQAAKENTLDTDVTPVAKKSDLWTLLHGAEYPETEVREDSVTTFDTDLHAVSFQNRTIGLAGGSQCATEPVRQEGEDESEFGARSAACEGTDGSKRPRVPTLYRYTEPLNGDPRWERLALPGSESPGFIGAIAWIDSQRALIVGGTGTYPRREGAANDLPATDPAKPDQAGRALAWVYDRATDEVTDADPELASLTVDETDTDPPRAGMRGLSAVACNDYPPPEPGEPKRELCFAGALGQIWEWRDGEFNGTRIDALSPESELKDGVLFRYRVRDIRVSGDPASAIALTAGCCATDPGKNTPRRLVYDEATSVCEPNPHGHPEPVCTRSGPPRWYAQSFYERLLRDEGPRWPWYLGLTTVRTPLGLGGQPILPPIPSEAHHRRREQNDTPTWPDSVYSMAEGSVILSAGDPDPDDDPPSVITGRRSNTPAVGPEADANRTQLSTARLLDGDGDVAATDPNRPFGLGGGGGEPDWVVGELRSTQREGRGARGLLVATALPPSADDAINQPEVTNEGSPGDPEPRVRPTQDELIGGYDPLDEERLAAHVQSRHFLLPSYTANAVEIVGAQEDGWMVGDHGAILRISEKAAGDAEGAAEPKPPKLGTSRPHDLAERDAYDDSRPVLPKSSGLVPELGGEREALPEPRMLTAGSPGGTVTSIVMSRDGSEGWAIGWKGLGGVGSVSTFYRFDGTTWSECDPVGVKGSLTPDPACAELAPVRSGGRFSLVSRVPLEYDADPTNDDELEIVAMTSSRDRVMIRYRDGRWRVEDPQVTDALPGAAPLHMAFAAPDDGWLVTNEFNKAIFYRFNGEHWVSCMVEEGATKKFDPALCDDPDLRLPADFDAKVAGLTAAGGRTYLYGIRLQGCLGPGLTCNATRRSPLILYHDRNGAWTDGSGPGGDKGGFDPAFANPGTEEAGQVFSLSVVERADGEFEGWATGTFGAASITGGVDNPQPSALVMRLDPGAGEGWRELKSPGPLEDYGTEMVVDGFFEPIEVPRLQASYPTDVHPGGAFIGIQGPALGGSIFKGHIFGFDPARERFELVDAGRPAAFYRPAGQLTAMAPDGEGGFWAAVSGDFLHYTDKPPKPLFTEAPHPLGIRAAKLRDIDAGPDGSVWLASASDRLYRYDRLAGWEEARVPGWDPGRVVTRASEAEAIAIGAGGEGVVVGEGGRIANLSASEITLDPAAGRSCALGDPAPCGSSRDLLAVDVASDGSVVAGGKRRAVLWRPAGGEFRATSPLPIASSTTIVAVSYPRRERAYVATDSGVIFRGELSGEQWSWRKDNFGADGEPLFADEAGEALGIADLAIDAEGHGYAVGEQGLVIERSEAGGWRRLANPSGANLATVSLPEMGGPGVLLGGPGGLILTGAGAELRVARAQSLSTGPVEGFAYLPGSSEGSVDAWSALAPTKVAQGHGTDERLLRYRLDTDDPLVEPSVAATALADAPPEAAGGLALGAFGKSDCEGSEANSFCPELIRATTTNDVILARVVAELTGQSAQGGGVDLALSSGDATDTASLPASSVSDLERVPTGRPARVERMGQIKHRRYAEIVARGLEDDGVPFLSAIGGQDLTEAWACNYAATDDCIHTKAVANAGENLAWREAFGGRLAPWGSGEDVVAEGELELEPAPGSEQNSLRTEDQRADADGEGSVPEAKAEIGGASTHYALDAVRDGEAVARIVFVDTSMRSLAASDPQQQPHELGGGQQRFLERMICKEGQSSTFGDRCTREKDQKAIVVSNTPTYSYGPGALTHTATDATTFEATMLRYDVDLVISGALGYNGLYYTLAPGLHEPCPGGGYPEGPPAGKTPDCVEGPTGNAAAQAPDPQKLASVITGEELDGAYPTLIASGAGGKFGPDGMEGPSGPEGRWHGYSVARLMPSGDLVVEQRPILDWIGLEAARKVIRPRQKALLNGYGRSPISTDAADQPHAFHYEISSAAITHRYDLLRADPERPWLALEDAAAGAEADGAEACEGYVCLPEDVATVDSQSGQVKAGSGKHPPTYAIAMLSVGEKVATTPLFFEPSPSFRFEAPTAPRPTPNFGAVAAPGTPSAPTTPQVPNVSVPTPPVPPALVPPPPAPPASPPQPPVPPPVPPANAGPSALSLSFAPTGLVVAPTASVIPPPAPPINPAPPGGARKEARQRQAATQKSGADAAEKEGVDLADGPPTSESSQMTRRENAATRRGRVQPGQSFTPLNQADQPSAWATGALYGGGITILAFVLAAGWTRGRPTPRGRHGNRPAPSWGTSTRTPGARRPGPR